MQSEVGSQASTEQQEDTIQQLYKWRLSIWNQVNIEAFSTAFHHTSAGQTGARFPKPNFVNLCCISISNGFRKGKEDHYYILSIRTLIYGFILFFAWPGILLSVAAIIKAKKVVMHGYSSTNIQILMIMIHCT